MSTNSITQGEQVAQLWAILFQRHGLEIAFAHRTFGWGSDARGKAHVHVVIIGLTRREDEPTEKRLFSYEDINGDPDETRHTALSPYLFDASQLVDRHLVVRESARPLCGQSILKTGSQPIDGGYYIFNDEEKLAFASREPKAVDLFVPFPGADEYINGRSRWLLHLKGIDPVALRRMPAVVERMNLVREFRSQSQRKGTLDLAQYPNRLNVELFPEAPFLSLPEVSSERREYIPIGWLEPPTVPSNKLRALLNASRWEFGVLTSRMHTAWSRFIGGRLKSDFQYSVGLNYNAFPWPTLTDADKARLDALAQAVLDARAAHPGATLADLYDPDVMPADLRRAHRTLDQAVDRLYRKTPFDSDRERVEHLFTLYEKMTAGLLAAPGKARKMSKRDEQEDI